VIVIVIVALVIVIVVPISDINPLRSFFVPLICLVCVCGLFAQGKKCVDLNLAWHIELPKQQVLHGQCSPI
jgi:hypothetical protein